MMDSKRNDSFFAFCEGLLPSDATVELHQQLTEIREAPFPNEENWFNYFPDKVRPTDALILAGEGAVSTLHRDPFEWTGTSLCLEGVKEHWRSLNRLCDVSELISNQQINWKLLLANAETVNKKEVVFLGLYLAHTILDTPIPDFVLQEVNYHLNNLISKDKIYKFLFRKEFSLLTATQWYLFISQAFPSSIGKINYLYRVIIEKLESKK